MKNLTLKKLRENGIELINFTSRGFTINNTPHIYKKNNPIKLYIYYYEKEYILYKYIIGSAKYEEYETLKEAQERLSKFINVINTNC